MKVTTALTGATSSVSPPVVPHPAVSLGDIVESLPVGVVGADASGRIVFVNPELERLFGYSRSELLGQILEILLPERFRSAHQALRMQYIQEPERRAMGAGRELFGRRKDGTEIPIEIGLNPVQTPEGLTIVASVVDISARQRFDANFRRIIEAAPYGMFLTDRAGRIILANERAGELFGYLREELLGQSIEILLPERYRASHLEHRNVFAAQPSMRPVGPGRDLLGLHKDGTEFPVEVGLSPLEVEDGPAVLAAVIDITGRKKMEMDLRQANVDLEEFTYVASHDLKSPLRGISDLVEWIGEDLGEAATPEVRHNLDRVGIRIKRMECLINDLLDYARAGRASAECEDVDPKELIEDIIDLLSVPAGFQVDVDVASIAMKTARPPIETVLRNLIDNAIHHHDKGQGHIRVEARGQGAFCRFSVSDDGPGIPPMAHARVFKLFQTLDSVGHKGSGIGLAVAKRLVEGHGGRIEIESREGQRGTTFRVWWPRFQRRDLGD